MENTENKIVTIYLESNPNPHALKFVANFMLVPEGVSVDFPDVESAKSSPIAVKLFQHDYVKRVFFMSNFITVTKDESLEWAEVQQELKDEIKTYLESGQKIFTSDPTPEKKDEAVSGSSGTDGQIEEKIKSILDEYIRPAVEQDGGAISFHSYHEGTVKVLLQGSCSGCPSSTITLKAGIENLLKRSIPEVMTVEAEGV